MPINLAANSEIEKLFLGATSKSETVRKKSKEQVDNSNIDLPNSNNQQSFDNKQNSNKSNDIDNKNKSATKGILLNNNEQIRKINNKELQSSKKIKT